MNPRKRTVGYRNFIVTVMAFIALSLITVSTCFSADSDSGLCSDIDLSTISNIVKGPLSGVTIASKTPVESLGLCQVILHIEGGDYITCYVADNAVLLGRAFQDGRDISEDEMQKIRRSVYLEKKAELAEVVALKYEPAVKKRVLYMITDPLCPYCQKVGPDIKALADEYGVEINVILYSVHGKAGDADCIDVACSNVGYEHYLKTNWQEKTNKQECDAGQKLIDKAKTLVSGMGIRGVPMFILDDGQSIAGGNIPGLKEALENSL
ncbi:MAG: thioredoxin fold domain-containing protein [Desulfobacteria bacterium]